ncbi:uncharacterized protein LOC135502717 [Lineus longissimus]|uniref:uncharacterized protein LOC135502717 n=1 Tax=Lineus longissimus TaxID=88925 RepID=UPI00315C69C3
MATGCMKEVTVVCGSKRKFVKIDFGSFEKTMEAIRQKWKLSDDFELQTASGEKGEMYDIEDDDDLERFKDTTVLIVRPSAAGVPFMTSSGSMASSGVRAGSGFQQPHLPPSYECSIMATAREVPASESQDFQENAIANIRIHGVTHSLHEPPPPDSVIVENEVRTLAPKFEIGSILRKMDIVADCLSMAYYGVVADAGLHKKVQDMQFDVLGLSHIMDRTVMQYRTKAGDIIGDLECGFGYLLDGFEKEALESFQAICVTSEQLKEMSETLKEKIHEKEEKFKGLLDHVTEKHRETMSEANAKQESSVTNKQKLIEKKLKQAEEDTFVSLSRCTNFEEMERDARKNDTAATKSASSFSHGFFKMVTLGFYEGDPIVAEQQDKLANIAREDLQNEREELKRYHDAQNKAHEALNELTQSLKCTEDIAEMALRGAETGIKSLQASLQSAVGVWDNLHEECESISNSESLFAKLRERKTEEERKEFWSCPTFKKGAMKFYARWVALQCICDKFHKGMNRIEQKLHFCIQDNPSVREAKDKIPRLIEQFDERQKAEKARTRAEAEAEHSEEESAN